MPTIVQEEKKVDVKKERKPISNLPQERLNLIRGQKKSDEDSVLGFSPEKKSNIINA